MDLYSATDVQSQIGLHSTQTHQMSFYGHRSFFSLSRLFNILSNLSIRFIRFIRFASNKQYNLLDACTYLQLFGLITLWDGKLCTFITIHDDYKVISSLSPPPPLLAQLRKYRVCLSVKLAILQLPSIQ